MSDKNNEDDESRGLLSSSTPNSEQYNRQNNVETHSPLQQSGGGVGGSISNQTQNRSNNIKSYGSTNYIDADVSERASLLSPASEGMNNYHIIITIYYTYNNYY
jgi:hypothetical protein